MRRSGLIGIGIATVVIGGIAIRIASSEVTEPTAVTEQIVGVPDSGWQVSRIVDGDTIVVTRGSERQKVRLLGIDTPESVRPDSPVECFGPEASDFATGVLQGRAVTLESDPTQGEMDDYGRRLAYVWYVDAAGKAVLFNVQTIAAGMAREYTYEAPYMRRDAFIAAQQEARSANRGLWLACAR